MEAVHTGSAAAKRMWRYLRAVLFMVRKGVLSNKRKLFVSIHLLMKRRNKALARTVANLLSHHHHNHNHHYGYGNGNALRRREYEFSCSNSPVDPAFFSSSGRRRGHHAYYFPCLGEMDAAASPAAPRIEYYYAASSPAMSSPGGLLQLPGEESPAAAGAYSVRVSDYSAEDEEEGAGGGSEAVDDEAEEFIRRFYEQLRRQNHVAMLPYMQEIAA